MTPVVGSKYKSDVIQQNRRFKFIQVCRSKQLPKYKQYVLHTQYNDVYNKGTISYTR